MAKSKSRHKHASAAQRYKSGETARTATLANKTTAKDESATTLVVDEAEEKIEKETSTTVLAEDAPEEETEQEEASPVKSARAASAKSATKVTAGDGAKTGKAVPTTPAPGKAAATRAAARAVPNTPPLKAIPVTPAGVGGKAPSRDAAKYERRRLERQTRYLAERRARRNRILIVTSVVLALLIIGTGTFYFVHQYTGAGAASQQRASQGSFQEPIFNSSYPPVDSVYCDQLEQSVEHIHVYIVVYINGQASPLPAGVGIPQDSTGNAACFYWLHTHDSSGVVHIESPSSEVFTFGQFRDEWQQQFASLGLPSQLLLNPGWKIWINGKVYSGTLSSIPLEAHNVITMAYNSPNVKPATTYNWNGL